ASTYVSQTPVNIAYDNLRVYSSSGEAGAIVGEMPELIKDYGADWTETIAELEALRVIASGGQLIFSENRAFMDGTIGAEFYPLASTSNYADVIFGGEMTITLAEDDSILCGF